MNTPWINYEKMEQISLTQKTSLNTPISEPKQSSFEIDEKKDDKQLKLKNVKNRKTGKYYYYCQIPECFDCQHYDQDDELAVSDNVMEEQDSEDLEYASQFDQLDELSESSNDSQVETAIELVQPMESELEEVEITLISIDEFSELYNDPQVETAIEFVHPQESELEEAESTSTSVDELVEPIIDPQNETAFEPIHPQESKFIEAKTNSISIKIVGKSSQWPYPEDIFQVKGTVEDIDESYFSQPDEPSSDPQVESALELTHPQESELEEAETNSISIKDLSEPSNWTDSNEISQVNETFEDINVFQPTQTEEQHDEQEIESSLKHMHSSESNSKDNMIDISNSEDIYESDDSNEMEEIHTCGKIYSITTNSPFTAIVEINDFLHFPIFGRSDQNTIEFIDLNNRKEPQLDTKLVNTTAYYEEEIYGRLVSAKTFESISITATVHAYDGKKHDDLIKTFATPVHDMPVTMTEETNDRSYPTHHLINVRLPVIVGEYKIEIPLEEDIMFEEEILRIKEISKEVLLKECRFVPTQFNPSLCEGTRKACKGNLFLKGYIHQNIEYSVVDKKKGDSIQKESVTDMNHIHQKIVLELIVHILQIQPVRISCDGTNI